MMESFAACALNDKEFESQFQLYVQMKAMGQTEPQHPIKALASLLLSHRVALSSWNDKWPSARPSNPWVLPLNFQDGCNSICSGT
jgi:hypothetical protein